MDRYSSFESISVVIPVYNSEATLRELVSRIEKTLTSFPHEILLVNDASRDGSWEVILELAEKSENVRGINLMRNYGQDNALLCGIRAARHDVIVTIDDDLQHPPEQIHALLDKLDQGRDLVYATAQGRQQCLHRHMVSAIARGVLENCAGMKNARRISSFRAFRSHLREAFVDFRAPLVSIDTLLSWGAQRVEIRPIRFARRKCGNSNYNWKKLLLLTLNAITSLSVFPLRIVGAVGLAFLAAALVLQTYSFWEYLTGRAALFEIPFFLSLGFLFSGFHLLALGIVAEYLARIFLHSMGKPPYVVLSRTKDR